MSKKIVVEGKTSTEAIEKGLRELHVSKDKVEIKVLENEEKKSFFSILTPRVVKVEITIKEEKETGAVPKVETAERRESTFIVNEKDLEEAKQRVELFLQEFLKKLTDKAEYKISVVEGSVEVIIEGENTNYLIGYRGETLNSLQVIISSIANKGLEQRCKVLLDIEGYRAKREKTLEELAGKIAKTVLRTKKAVTLEPMSSYERKIIHSKLQEHRQIKTYSTGEEPYRKVVIALK